MDDDVARLAISHDKLMIYERLQIGPGHSIKKVSAVFICISAARDWSKHLLSSLLVSCVRILLATPLHGDALLSSCYRDLGTTSNIIECRVASHMLGEHLALPPL